MMIFEYVINAYESLLFTFFLYCMTEKKENRKMNIVCSILFSIVFFLFISYINLFSDSESVFVVLEYTMNFLFISFIGKNSFSQKLFVATSVNNLTGIETMLILVTSSFLLLNKIDYDAFIQQYRIGYVLFAQVIHTVSLYYVVKIWIKIGKLVNNTDYLLLTGAFTFCNLMTISIEAAIFGYPQKDLYMILGIYSVIFFILLLLLLFKSVYMHTIAENRQKLDRDILLSQAISNRKILEAQKDLHQLRHDMKHLVRVLREFNEQQTSEEVIHVLERYEKEVEQDRVPIQTMSSAVNTILNIKREEAILRNIDITVNANITHPIQMEDSDLYLVLSNLMDNAIEHIGTEKKIRVVIKEVEQMMVIQVSNSIDTELLNSSHELYNAEREENHGFGVSTIKQIAEKYKGFLSYVEDDHMLSATVLLPIILPEGKDA